MPLPTWAWDYDPRTTLIIKQWARRLRRIPFKQDDFLSFRWKFLHNNEIELETVWWTILIRRRTPADEFDFDFIEPEYLDEHIFMAYWLTFNLLLDKKYSQPGILMNGLTLPRHFQARALGPYTDPMRPYRHAAPVIDVKPMEEFSYAETLEENDEFLTKLWKEAFKSRKVILGHSLWLRPFWKKLLKWERACELAKWKERARRQRRYNFIATWASDYGEQPAWMHRNKRISNNLDFIWHNIWRKYLKLDRNYDNQRAWNEAYVWNQFYLKPRQNIHQQEPCVLYQRWTWEQERLASERKVLMSKKLEERRFNIAAQRHLCWNEEIDRWVYLPKIEIPRPLPIPLKEKIVYQFDEFGKFVDPPPPYVNVIHYRDEDEQQKKYDDFMEAKKDVLIPPPKIPPPETRQAIWDQFFTNRRSKTLGELFDKNKNYDKLLPVLRWRKNCYDPHVPKPETPHPYLVRGTAPEKVKKWKKNKLWKAKMAEYEEKLKQGLKPRHPALPPPPPPLPYTLKEHLTFTHQDHIRRMRRGDRHEKFVELNGEPITDPDEELTADWVNLIVDRIDPKTGKLMTVEEFIRVRDEEERIKKLQDEWDAKHYPYYKNLVDKTTMSHVIGIRSKGISFYLEKLHLGGKELLRTSKTRPIPIYDNEFLEHLEGYDSLSPLSDKAGQLVNMMKRQIAAADDILKNVHLPDGGKAWNLERKGRRSSNESSIP